MKIPKKVTPKKAKANKQNAAESTGAKSQRGKFFASQNAITHGFYARDILLPGEREAEFNQLLGEMIIDRAPVGIREYQRVERLAWHEWRWRRFRRAENGEIAVRLADHQPVAEMGASTHTPQYDRAVRALNQLEQIEEQVESEGRISADNLDLIRKMPCFEIVKDLLQLAELAQSTESEDDLPSSPEMPDAQSANGRTTEAISAAQAAGKEGLVRSVLLDALGKINHAIKVEKLYHVQHLGLRSAGKRDACLLPQEADLNRLVRWENHLWRQIERDENALERMQRLRRGEKVPPPTARNS